MLLLCAVALSARLSIGSLKYMHHFGLDFFSISGAHWVLHAALTHSINDALFVLSFASDASALAANDLRGIDFVGDKTCPVGGASLTGSCRA